MTPPDLNLLIALDVLLQEGSVARAARRLRLSPSAMSRTLARLRAATGDPLLVRAGRGLVPTPHALALRTRVAQVAAEAESLLRPVALPDLGTVTRTFALRCSEGFVESFAPALLARLEQEAPGLRLRFVPKPDRDSAPLRDGAVDLETGVIGAEIGPEVRTQALFTDRFVGVVAPDHPFALAPPTPAAYAAARHVLAARPGAETGLIDQILDPLGLRRRIAVLVGGFAAALALARSSALVATVPERHTAGLRRDLVSFPLPFAVPEITVSLLWHPRLDADPVHRWLRGSLREVCA